MLLRLIQNRLKEKNMKLSIIFCFTRSNVHFLCLLNNKNPSKCFLLLSGDSRKNPKIPGKLRVPAWNSGNSWQSPGIIKTLKLVIMNNKTKVTLIYYFYIVSNNFSFFYCNKMWLTNTRTENKTLHFQHYFALLIIWCILCVLSIINSLKRAPLLKISLLPLLMQASTFKFSAKCHRKALTDTPTGTSATSHSSNP